MARGVLVFDDEQQVTTVTGSGQSFVILDAQSDVVALAPEVSRRYVLEGDADEDMLLVDGPTTSTTIVGEPEVDFVLVDRPVAPARVVMPEPDGDLRDVVLLTAGGPPGPAGPTGPAGPEGPAGTDGAGAYLQDFGFATPSTVWTIVHNQNQLALNVETLGSNGEPIEGYVLFVDANTIEIHWYYPTAGTARVFR